MFFHRPPMHTAIVDFKGFIKKSMSCRQDVIRIAEMPTYSAFMMYSLFYQHVIGLYARKIK